MNLLRSLLVLGACAGGIFLPAMMYSVHAGEECASLGDGCDNGAWDPMQKLDEIGTATGDQSVPSAKWPEKSRMVRWNKSAYGFEDYKNNFPENESMKILVSIEDVSDKDILLDVSESSIKHIEGSAVIPYTNFTSGAGILKPLPEIAKILGDAGISRNDSVVAYSECLSCGGGPFLATQVYWMMKLLGHENVKVLDGTAENWAAAGKPMSADARIRPVKDYTAEETADAAVTCEYVKSGQAQIVDARTSQEYESGNIPGSISMPYYSVLNDNRIKDASGLNEVFAGLNRDKPVVVYTNTGAKASVVWFALEMMGYDARLYSWRDWLENQPKFEMELAEVDVNPNPVRSNETATITASFREKQLKPKIDSSTGKEMTLKVMGCASCGFGSPQGFANLDHKSGAVQIGGNVSDTGAGAAGGSMRCTAIINGPNGSEVGKTSLLHTLGNTYMGIWKASVVPGDYSMSISVSASGDAEVFEDVQKIEVTG